MVVEVSVMLGEAVDFPGTAVCRVEIQDVSLLDAPSVTLSALEEPVGGVVGKNVLTASLELTEPGAAVSRLNVWAQLSMTGSKQIQAEDYVTTQAYPVASGIASQQVTVVLQPVRPVRK